MSNAWASTVDNPVRRWLFITGDRRWVTVALVVGFVAFTAVAIRFDLIYVGPGSNLSTALSSGLLSGLLTLLTVALSINQLILSRLFGSAGTLSDQLEGTLEYRRTVEGIADVAVSPNHPSAFIGLLGETLTARAEAFQRAVEQTAGGLGSADELDAYVSALTAYGDHLSTAAELDDPMKVVVITLGTEYADHLDTTREFQSKYSEELSNESEAALTEILELLKASATMRQFFKTLTLQQDLAMLSRRLIYTGVPSILVTYFLAQTYTSASNLPTAIEPTYMPLVVVVATAIILSPLAVLVASLLRVATVSLYTVSVGSFIPPEKSISNE